MFNFGQSSQQQKPLGSTGSSMFSFNQPQTPQTSTSAFSGLQSNSSYTPQTQTQSQSQPFQFSTQTQQPQQSPQTSLPFMLTPQTATGITYPRETNFLDLPAELRQNVEALEKIIQGHADASRPFSSRVDPTDNLSKIDDKLTLLEEKISAYSTVHSQQNQRILNLKRSTSAHWRYSESSARTIEASRHVSSDSKITWTRAFAPNDPTSSHFEDILHEMKSQLDQAESMFEAIRRQIDPILNNANTSASESHSHSPIESVKLILRNEQEISSVLIRRFNQVHDEMEVMRRNFRTFCQKYRRDSRDPFVSKVTETRPERFIPYQAQLPVPPPTSTSISSGFPAASTTPTTSSSLFSSSMLPSATTGLAPKATTASSPFGGFNFGR